METQTLPTAFHPPQDGNPYTGRLVPVVLTTLLLLSFLCPWFTGADGLLLSGFNVWHVVQSGKILWFFPLAILYTFYAVYSKRGFAIASVLTGLFPFVYLAYIYFGAGERVIPRVAFGWWLAIFIGFLLAAAGARSTAFATRLIRREKAVEVLDHFYIPLDGFNMSSREFYEALQKVLLEKKVPGLSTTFIQHHEESVLSAKRTYLRLIRGRLVFDICAAPFGRYYFFSSRFCVIPVSIHPLEVFLLILGLYVGFVAFASKFGMVTGCLLLVLCAVLLYGSMRHLVAWLNERFDLDFPEIPIFGALYARFHKETYHEYDTKLMYQTVIPQAVRDLAGEFSAQKGFQRMEEYRRVPGMADVYQTHFHHLKACQAPSTTN